MTQQDTNCLEQFSKAESAIAVPARAKPEPSLIDIAALLLRNNKLICGATLGAGIVARNCRILLTTVLHRRSDSRATAAIAVFVRPHSRELWEAGCQARWALN